MLTKIKNTILFLFAVCLWSPQTVFSQTATLTLVPVSLSNIRLSDTFHSISVRNTGDTASEPFQVKLWVSIDDTYTDNAPATSPQPLVLAACADPSDTLSCPISESVRRNFKFPLPDQIIDPSERLSNDTKSPSEWVGDRVYYKACISVSGGPFGNCIFGSRVVVAPAALPYSVSQGTSTSSIDVKWRVPPTDNGVSLVDYYQLSEFRTDSVGGNQLIRIEINDLEIVDEADGQQTYLHSITDIEPGVSYSYFTFACNDLGGCPNAASGRSDAFALGQFSASEGTETGGVEIDWREFSVGTDGYDLRRCRADAPEDCQIIKLDNLSTSYVDQTVERGVEYIYEVYSCERFVQGSNDCQTNEYFKTGITNAGFPNLIDEYEDDDNAQQAQKVRSTVSQLHSFDTPDDEDWIEIILSTPQAITVTTSGNTSNDTELTLYQDDATTEVSVEPLGDGSTLYAAIGTDVLPAGRYYLKVFQFDPGLDALYKAVANYQLDIVIPERPVILAPIIDLLLSDE